MDWVKIVKVECPGCHRIKTVETDLKPIITEGYDPTVITFDCYTCCKEQDGNIML